MPKKKQKSFLEEDIPVEEVKEGAKAVFRGIVGLIPTHKKKLDAKNRELERMRRRIERIKKSKAIDREIEELRKEEEQLKGM